MVAYIPRMVASIPILPLALRGLGDILDAGLPGGGWGRKAWKTHVSLEFTARYGRHPEESGCGQKALAAGGDPKKNRGNRGETVVKFLVKARFMMIDEL